MLIFNFTKQGVILGRPSLYIYILRACIQSEDVTITASIQVGTEAFTSSDTQNATVYRPVIFEADLPSLKLSDDIFILAKLLVWALGTYSIP